MAMVDDPEWLLSHIQHSFITSDDTGMCEMVIQSNDLYTLEEHRQRLRVGRSDNSDNSQIVRAPSPDITSGWDFGVRRRSNTAQKLERIRKERQNRIKIKTVHWKQMPNKFVSEHLEGMFEKKDLTKQTDKYFPEDDLSCHIQAKNENIFLSDSKATQLQSNVIKTSNKPGLAEINADSPVSQNIVALFEGFNVDEEKLQLSPKQKAKKSINSSALSRMLEKTVEVMQNPFKEYTKYDGRGHLGTAATQFINIFVHIHGEEPPRFSIPIVVLTSGAKIQDLIGLTCCRYLTEKFKPDLKRNEVQGYALYIAEDDGEVDYGFPPFDNSEPVSKFSFPTLALVEKPFVSGDTEGADNFHESVFVKVNDYTGFSLIQVDDLSITMGEILKKAVKRRKGNKHCGTYKLEFQDKPGVVVDDDQTLDSTGVMEFCMVREHSARSRQNYPTEEQRRYAAKTLLESKTQSNIEKTVQYIGLQSLT